MESAERDMAERGVPRRWRPTLRRWLDNARVDPARPDPPEERPDRLERADRPAGPGRDGPPEDRLDPMVGDPGVPGLDPRRPPPRSDPANFGPRVAVLAPDGQTVLAGRPESLERPGQTRAIKLAGETVALLRLAERAGPAQGVDASFLRRQYQGLAAVALAVVVLALALARWIAQRWTRPLREAQTAARMIAGGDFGHRLPQPGQAAEQGASELGELQLDINAMAGALQTLESSRRRWIAELAHELRTPLAVLRGELEALADGIRPLERGAITSLQEEVKRLSRLVDDFHLLAVSEMRALPCDFGPVAPAALLRSAVDRVGPRARQLGLSVTADLPPVLPAAEWDGERIEQLLANLLENSLRYTQVPGMVRVQARADTHMIEIRVEDSPPGVPAADLEKLFDPLYRADPSRSRAFGGSGLGLPIARALARAHGGSLHAEASPLGGLSMVLRLPLQARKAA
jgi:two-component system sensor histidine kinase BaeS